jgi:hypothetical protein
VSQISGVYAELPTYRCANRRTLAGIQRNVVKQGKRNAITRFIRSKAEKDKIVGWKQDLAMVLHVFNVRLIGSAGYPRLNYFPSDRTNDQERRGECR